MTLPAITPEQYEQMKDDILAEEVMRVPVWCDHILRKAAEQARLLLEEEQP